MVSSKAEKWISRKISKLRREGYPQRESIAIAYAMARDRGFRVPRKKK